jgi:hypothetical protein
VNRPRWNVRPAGNKPLAAWAGPSRAETCSVTVRMLSVSARRAGTVPAREGVAMTTSRIYATDRRSYVSDPFATRAGPGLAVLWPVLLPVLAVLAVLAGCVVTS